MNHLMVVNALTADAVVETVKEWRAVGPAVFRQRYGFSAPSKYGLSFDNETFDSKAIAAVAFQHIANVGRALDPTEITGGMASPACAGQLLTALGFDVRSVS